jgi:hypothetical protein
MKITVISDTHRNYARLKDVVDRNLDSDLFVHLGDGIHEVMDISSEYAKKYPHLDFTYVRGNSDYIEHDEEAVVEIAGLKIFCTHGHNFDIHWGLDKLTNHARDLGCKIALFGHTHIYRAEQVGSLYVMNPGSLDRPRGGNRATYGTITISERGTVSMNIVAYKESKEAI